MKITPESIKRGLTTDPRDLKRAMSEFQGQVAMLTTEVNELREQVGTIETLKKQLREAENAQTLLKQKEKALREFQEGIRDIQNFVSSIKV